MEHLEAKPTIETALTRFDPLAATIAVCKIENANLAFNLEYIEDRKDAKKHISKLRQIKTEIANVHKEVKAEALAYGRAMDAKKNEYTLQVDEMIDHWAVPIKEIETREFRRMAQIAEDRRLAIEEAEAKRIADLNSREAAILAKEQAAKEEQDRITRERAAEIASENARMNAENEKLRAAQAKLEEEKRALEAKQLGEEDAQRRVIEAREAERERIRKEQEAKAAAEAKRVADVAHRNKIEAETFHYFITRTYFSAMEGGDSIVTGLIENLKHGNVPNVTINY